MSISRSFGLALVLSVGFGLNASAASPTLVNFLKTGTTTPSVKATVAPKATPTTSPTLNVLPSLTPTRPGGSNGCGPRPI